MQPWNEILAWAAQTPPAAPPAGPGGSMMFMLMGAMVIMILWTVLISNPKRKAEEKKRQEAIDNLNRGDKVVTTAGIHGTIESVEKDKGIVNVTVAPKVVISFSRNAIASYTRKEDAKELARDTAVAK